MSHLRETRKALSNLLDTAKKEKQHLIDAFQEQYMANHNLILKIQEEINHIDALDPKAKLPDEPGTNTP